MKSLSESIRPALVSAYDGTGFDPLNARNLLQDEVRQRRETGYDVDEIVVEANSIDPQDDARILALVDRATESVRDASWPFVEPDSLDEIRATLPDLPRSSSAPDSRFEDRVNAAWLGRVAGCNIGKPVEEGVQWTPDHIRDYLELANAYPLRDYVPALDPMPAGFAFKENWPHTTRGNVDGGARDDDVDYSILAVQLLESHGKTLTPEKVGESWTTYFPLRQLYTAERAAYINLADGYRPTETARRRNPYREWIGAQIRGDVYGYVFAGDPWSAAELAYQDAALSHVGNGIYGEMWSAALNAAAFASSSVAEAIEKSIAVVPPQSRLFEAVTHVVGLHAAGVSWESALNEIRASYGQYAWVHTVNNAAVVAAALLWGAGDYMRSVGYAVMSGWDTDSNGATVGSVAGIFAGTALLPEHVIDPLKDRTRSALFGFDSVRISDLADRTIRLSSALK